MPPTSNTPELAQRLKARWTEAFGEERVGLVQSKGMGAEDFPFFTVDPTIPTVYWAVGGTPPKDLLAAEMGGPPVPSHHSPFFKVEPEPSVRAGVESTVIALRELLGPAP